MKYILRLWFVILGIIIIWLYFIFISPKIFNNQIVTIPNVLNLNEERTIATLTENNVKFKIAYIENDEEVTLRTIPYAGTTIKADNVITVYIGKRMPEKYHSYLGLLYNDVIDQINIMCEKNGLNLKIEYEEVENYISGIIIKESLTDGDVLNQNSELCLTISVNTDSFLMPDLVGMSIDEAIELLKDYNVKINLIYYQTPIDSNLVIFQSTQANTLVNKNNPYELDLYISKGLAMGTIVKVDDFITVIQNLGYDMEIIYVKSNIEVNNLVAFEVQKLYDINVTKYILWITE